MAYSRIFSRTVTLTTGYNQLSAVLTAEGYKGTFSLAQLRITDLAGDTTIIFTDDATTPGAANGEVVGAAGSAKLAVFDGNQVPIPATNVWLHQASGHAVAISVLSF